MTANPRLQLSKLLGEIMNKDTYTLIDMLFDRCPLQDFEKLLKSGDKMLDWGELLHMCYCEESYASVGGDEGYLENSPVDFKYLAYLEKLIAFLEENGIKESD